MARPANREQLIDYCLRRLGDPVIEINVDEDQLSDFESNPTGTYYNSNIRLS